MCALSLWDALRIGSQKLAESGIGSAEAEARQLIEYATGKPLWRTVAEDTGLSDEGEAVFLAAVEARATGRPLQYIIGTAPFLDTELDVDANVLIPRFDTECVAEKAIVLAASFKRPLVMDIGTGSGAIAISVALRLKDSRVIATDISPEALRIAKSNAAKYGILERMEFFESDLFKGIPASYEGSLDLVVSNPPYIAVSEMESVERSVKDFEPKSALSPGKDRLAAYRTLVTGAAAFLKRGGFLVLEIGDTMATEVRDLVKKAASYKNIEIGKDMSGADRVLSAARL